MGTKNEIHWFNGISARGRTATETGADAPEKRSKKYDFFEFKGAAGMSLEAETAGEGKEKSPGGGSNGVVTTSGWAQGQ